MEQDGKSFTDFNHIESPKDTTQRYTQTFRQTDIRSPPAQTRQSQKDTEGFTRVPPRKRKDKDCEEDTLETPQSESATSITERKENVEIVDLTIPERRNNYGTLQTKLHHQEPSTPAIDTFKDIINNRIRIALLDIDRREGAFVETAEQFEDK